MPGEHLTWFSQDQAILPRVHTTAWTPDGLVNRIKGQGRTGMVSVRVVPDTDPVAASALVLPIERRSLLGAEKLVLFQSGDPVGFPTDFAIVEAPAGAEALRQSRSALASLAPDSTRVKYRLIFRQAGAFPVAGQEFFLYERVA
jgi:hypothetical protein